MFIRQVRLFILPFPYTNNYEQKFEFTPEGIAKRAVATVDFWKDVPNIRSPINRAFQQLI
jgi:transketolase